MRNVRAACVVAIGFFLVPVAAQAQLSTFGSLAGVVRDASGAVLPGVTVEASSPDLIERVRTATTDGSGQFRIEAVPGLYTVAFSLPGFGTVRREGIELKSGFTTSVNVELKVGSLEETTTVPGESPAANYAVGNALIAPSLGRNLSNNAPNATVNIVEPGARFADYINQLDIRVATILRFGRSRTTVGVHVYNALNSNVVQTFNQAYIPTGAWLTPTLVLPARFAKVSAQIDF